MKYIILLIGSGGREHAIAKALFRTKDNEDKIDLYEFSNSSDLKRGQLKIGSFNPEKLYIF